MSFKRAAAVVALMSLVCLPFKVEAKEAAPANVQTEQRSLKGAFFSLRVGFGTSDPFPTAAALELQGQAGWALGRVALGMVIEYNPFIDFAKPDISEGAYNFGAFLAYRLPITPTLAFRFEGIAGGSVLLFDTYGYDRGDVGLWLGVKILGLDIYRRAGFSVVVDLLDLTLPIYHVATMPFIYPQWRWSVGFAFH